MAYDPTEEGELLKTEMDDSGELRCTVRAAGEELIEGARLRFPPGLRARLMNSDEGADCVFSRNGDDAEVLHAVDRAVTLALGDYDPGTCQLYSLGSHPQCIEIGDLLIIVGKKAQAGTTIQLGEGAQESVILGDKFTAALKTLLDAISGASTTAATSCAAAVDLATSETAIKAVGTALTTFVSAITAFEPMAPYLSTQVKVK